ncbi:MULTISPECIES: phage tail tip lysozyme [unclassified Enterococcus]|uniref:phage tail tip lysozyme n=1 Tax=unclassified Enterococcus TaxID=2608891 RepID=UPI0015548AC4|nr:MULTISPECIES: phage tail tip lysozyme [unclassified Enterococcus]MBS7576972.1 CHAP domain-containing protein [Enterococcus sp. MMGLQ5-2]MBS7584379.1 CHAP domain-containing protein [Enterococcus sp. MMGLQ5-1]NPD12234.1 phage tail lysozyme domain-containing protein [Enterococcus sp. MMGLQ5-1]NPD36806.1 phage tail lysozyme domain-containing protein [Enterococcus sp. MMGLQ5-2]
MKKIGIGLLLVCLPVFLILLVIISLFSNFFGGNSTDFQPQSEQEKTALAVYNFVLDKGGTSEFACAWLANLECESNLTSSRIQSDLLFDEKMALDPSIGGYGLGLPQWDKGRRVNFLNYAESKSVDWQTTDIQLEFAWDHDSTDSQLLKNLSKGTDLNQLTIDILVKWERAGTSGDTIEQARRKTKASDWYKRIVTGGMGAGSNIGGGQISILENKMGQTVYNGQCYGLTSFYVDEFNTNIHLGAGSPYGLNQTTSLDTVNAWNIGSTYAWDNNGFQVILNPSYSDIKAGDIINWKQGGYALSSYGHTGIIAAVSGNNQFITYEQNGEKGQIVAKYSRTWGQEMPNVASIVRKK